MSRVERWFPGRRARSAVVLSLIAALIALAFAVDALLRRYDWAYGVLDEIEPRYARLQGLARLAPQVESGLAEIDKLIGLRAYPAEVPTARVGTDFQQRIRRLAEDAGASVSGSQVLAPRPASGYELISLSANLEATPESLRSLLVALPAQVPTVQVESLIVQPSRRVVRPRGGGDDGRLSIQINLSVARLLP